MAVFLFNLFFHYQQTSSKLIDEYSKALDFPAEKHLIGHYQASFAQTLKYKGDNFLYKKKNAKHLYQMLHIKYGGGYNDSMHTGLREDNILYFMISELFH